MYTDIHKPELIRGLKFWVNPKNKLAVLMLHYTADPQKDPERQGGEWFKQERIGVPKATWLKEYEIDFSTKAGELIFGEKYCAFNKGLHFIGSFELPEPYELLFSLDFGQSNPTCGLVGAWTLDNRLYIIDEYYKPNLPSRSAREMYNKFEYLISDKGNMRDSLNQTFQIKVIDPTTRAKNRSRIVGEEEVSYSVLENFEDNGWEFELGSNDVQAGITRVREYLELDESGKPFLYIFEDKCPNLVREFTNYRYKRLTKQMLKTHNTSEEPMKKNDHACDALRYMVMTRPAKPAVKPIEKTFVQKDIERLLKPKVSLESTWDMDN